MKDNGEIIGATSGQWLYGVVASFDSESLDYASSNSLQFGVHDYNAFVDKDDSAWLPDINMTELKQCSNAQKMPPQSKFIQQPATGNTTNPDIPPVTPNDSFPLQLGSEGPNVAALQKSMGFSTQDQDGIFGPTTLYWVNQFKAKANMAQNGIIDPITWNSWIRNGAAPTDGPPVPPATPPANYGYNVLPADTGSCVIWYKSSDNVYVNNNKPSQTLAACRGVYQLSPGSFTHNSNVFVWATASGYTVHKDHFQWNGVNYNK